MPHSTSPLLEYNDHLAGVYDKVTTVPGAWLAPQECLQLLEPYLHDGIQVLELGVGTGRTGQALRKRGCIVTGIDISPRMIGRARRRLPDASLLHADILDPYPLDPDRRFDLVLAIGVLEFVDPLSRVFSNSLPFLKPRGLFCFTYEELLADHPIQNMNRAPRGERLVTPVPRSLSFLVYRRTPKQVRRLLASRGLRILADRQFVAYHVTDSQSGVAYPVIYRAVLARLERLNGRRHPHRGRRPQMVTRL